MSEADLIIDFRSAYDGDPPEPWFDDAIPCSLVNESSDRLMDIADYLDERSVPTPEAWAKLDPPATNWRSAVNSHRRRVGNLIRYRLEQWKQMRRREKQLRQGEPAKRRG